MEFLHKFSFTDAITPASQKSLNNSPMRTIDFDVGVTFTKQNSPTRTLEGDGQGQMFTTIDQSDFTSTVVDQKLPQINVSLEQIRFNSKIRNQRPDRKQGSPYGLYPVPTASDIETK